MSLQRHKKSLHNIQLHQFPQKALYGDNSTRVAHIQYPYDLAHIRTPFKKSLFRGSLSDQD
jgi:hypothetical protein